MNKLTKIFKTSSWELSGRTMGLLVDGLLLYTSTSMLYLGFTYVLPYFLEDLVDWLLVYMKVFYGFVYVQTLVNWFAAKLCTSRFTRRLDRYCMEPCQTIQATVIKGDHTTQCTLIDPNGPCGDGSNRKLYRVLTRERLALTWTWCKACHNYCPPRAHHCKVCKACILKRDHHCYFLNTCVGYHNQRHFILAGGYILFASASGLSLGLIYIAFVMFPFLDFWDWFLPETFLLWWANEIPFDVLLFIINLYLLPTGMIFTYFLTSSSMTLVVTGKTVYEIERRLRIRNSYSLLKNIKSIFGKYWYITWLWPFAYREHEDPTDWPNMEIVYWKPEKRRRKRVFEDVEAFESLEDIEPLGPLDTIMYPQEKLKTE